jgi:hypothetical protein
MSGCSTHHGAAPTPILDYDNGISFKGFGPGMENRIQPVSMYSIDKAQISALQQAALQGTSSRCGSRKMHSVRVSWRRFESMRCMRVRAPVDDGERFNWAVDGRMSGQQARPPAAEAASEPVAPHRLQTFDMVVDVVRI